MADHTAKQIEMPGLHRVGAPPSRAMFAALLGAVLADAWLASAPMPLGGPNVWFAALLLLLMAHHVVTRLLARGWRSFASDHRALLAASLPAGLLLVWAGTAFARSGDFDVVQLGRMAFGIGIFWATAMCVDSVGRAKAVLLVVLLATVVSASFGFGMLFVGEPFLGAWERLATIDDDFWEQALLGRLAGLTPHSSTLALHLVVALPVVAAALVWRSAVLGGARSFSKAAVLSLAAAVLILAAVLNGHRATMVGVATGGIVIAVFGWRVLRTTARRRLLWLLPLLAVWTGAFAQLAPAVFCADAAEQHLRLDRAGDIGRLYKGRVLFRGRGPSDDRAPHVQGHRFEHLDIRLRVLEVRPRYAEGPGEASAIVLEPTWRYAEISWYEPDDAERISAYEFRHRPVDDDDWTPWEGFVPAMSSEGQLFFHPAVDYRPAASRQTASDLGDDPNLRPVRHVLAGFEPTRRYLIQLEVRGMERRTMFPMTVRASAAGEVRLLWFERSRAPAPRGHRIRARLRTGNEWTPWQTLAHATDVDGRGSDVRSVDGRRTILDVDGLQRAPMGELHARHHPLDYLCHYVAVNRFSFFDASSASRVRQAADALHHLGANMLGAGSYFPERSAPGRSAAWDQRLDLVVDTAPHNQALLVAVLFGLPGLGLFGAFYAVVCWAALRTMRLALGSRSADCHFLAAVVVGAVVAYTTVSLSMPIGPFTFGWGHFYLLGLLFGVLRLVDASAEPQ